MCGSQKWRKPLVMNKDTILPALCLHSYNPPPAMVLMRQHRWQPLPHPPTALMRYKPTFSMSPSLSPSIRWSFSTYPASPPFTASPHPPPHALPLPLLIHPSPIQPFSIHPFPSCALPFPLQPCTLSLHPSPFPVSTTVHPYLPQPIPCLPLSPPRPNPKKTDICKPTLEEEHFSLCTCSL